jgi:hypothetical protein
MIYAVDATNGIVRRSTDKGDNWSTYVDVAWSLGPYNNYPAFAIDPSNCNAFYTVDENRDLAYYNGSSWSSKGLLAMVSKPSGYWTSIYNVMVDRNHPEVVYATLHGHGVVPLVFRSTNSGATWSDITYNKFRQSQEGLNINPHSGEVMIGGCSGTWVLPPPYPSSNGIYAKLPSTGGADITPPQLYNSTPGSAPAGTKQATLTFTTNEGATCRYSTTPGVAYDNMVHSFVGAGGSSHSAIVGSIDYSDLFNRDNENPLGNSVWTKAGTNSGALKIVDNQVVGSVNAGFNAAYYSGGVLADDQCSQATIISGESIGPLVRVQTGQTYLTGYGLIGGSGSPTQMGYAGPGDQDLVATPAEPRSFIYTATCGGNLMNAFLYHIGESIETAKVLVYLDDGDQVRNSGDTLVASSSVITSTSTPGWFSAAFSSGSLVSGSKYYLVIAPGTAYWEGRKNTNGLPDGYYGSTSYYSEPANMGTGTWTMYETGAEISMLITYQCDAEGLAIIRFNGDNSDDVIDSVTGIFIDNDIAKICIDGKTITGYKNGSPITSLSIDDPLYPGGRPGAYIYYDNTTMDAWSAAGAGSALVNGQSYTYNVRCSDAAGNKNVVDYPISFTIQTVPGGGSPPSAPADMTIDARADFR